MSEAVSITATCQNGQPISVLTDLIGKRMKVLREHGRDAVVAAAIDVVKSIRASTRDARKTKKFVIKVGPTQWHGSWYVEGGARKRCIRGADGRRVQTPINGIPCIFDDDGVVFGDAPVFLVETDRKSFYYLVCKDYASAYVHEKRRIVQRINRYGTLAKNALGIAMHMISTKGTPLEGSAEAKKIPQNLVKKVEIGDADHFGVHISDNLPYALEAVRDGQRGIDAAYKKAANKISGMLAQAAKKHGFFEDFPTPFPEVKRRK